MACLEFLWGSPIAIIKLKCHGSLTERGWIIILSTRYSRRRQTSPPVPPPWQTRPNSVVWRPTVSTNCRLDETYASSLILAISLHYVKIWRHPQNPECIMRWTSVKGRCHSNHFCGARRRQVGILPIFSQLLGKSQKPYPYHDPDEPSTSCNNFVNFGAVNHWDVEASLQKVGGCTHATIRTFSLFSPEFIDWSSPNFQKM